MDKKDLKIVFMGTPEFAVESLRTLKDNGYNIAGVITMPDKPGGRGHKVQFSAVKEYALTHNLPLLQPEKLKDQSFLDALKNWKADLQIVVAFRMLPEIVWNMPRFGTFNLHASLLPQYRGAAPINQAIINGEEKTGVTTFFLTHKIDAGKIIMQESIPIAPADNAGIIHDKLMTIGAQLVIKTVDALLEDKIKAIPQTQFIDDPQDLKPAPKIFKETCRIDWSKSPKTITDLIRGLSPYPTAWTELVNPNGDVIQIKIYSSHIVSQDKPNSDTGAIINDKKQIQVSCLNGIVEIDEIQLPGKKRMKTEDFLRGYKLPEGSFFK